MKSTLAHIYQFLLNISFDVVFGALCMAEFFAKTIEVNLPWFINVLLAIAVWSIYTLDHLLDAKRVKDNATTLRHSFHYRYFKLLITVVIILVLIGGVLAAKYLAIQTWYWGIGVVGVSAIHLLLTHFQSKDKLRFVMKEFGVALNYTLGVCVGGLSLLDGPILIALPYISVLLMCTLVNLLMYSYFDVQDDEDNGMASIATVLGADIVKWLILVLTALEGVFMGWYMYNGFSILFMVFCFGVTLSYAMLMILNNDWVKHHYKKFADLVFILPLLFI